MSNKQTTKGMPVFSARGVSPTAASEWSLKSALLHSLSSSNSSSSTFDNVDNGTNGSLFDVLNRPQPVHRLDKATGGLLVIAKTGTALQVHSMLSSYSKWGLPHYKAILLFPLLHSLKFCPQ